ncbi:MAG: SDR family oxidoreductase, partial [Pseudomonadota bacterium]
MSSVPTSSLSVSPLIDPFLIDPGRVDGPVLVTGAGGCIGSWTVAVLHQSGVPVIASDLTETRARLALLIGEDAAQDVPWQSMDVTDGDRVLTLCRDQKVTGIIHLAGLMVPFCKASPALGARVNVEGTINVLEAARHLGVKRVAYASSSAVYGMPPGGPTISTLYGAYKLANEHKAKVYWLDWGVPSVGIRP